MDINNITAEFNEATNRLLHALEPFDARHFISPPADGKWSASQVTEHLLLVETAVLKNFDQQGSQANRAPDQKIELVQTVFENWEQVYDAPGAFIPTGNFHNKTELIELITTQRKQLAELAKNSDLAESLPGFKHPYLGVFTRLEWIYFMIHHSNRHVKQLNQLSTTLLSS